MFVLRAGRGGAGLRRVVGGRRSKAPARVPAVLKTGARAARRRQRRARVPPVRRVPQKCCRDVRPGLPHRAHAADGDVRGRDGVFIELLARGGERDAARPGRAFSQVAPRPRVRRGRFLSSGAGARRRLRADVRRAVSIREGGPLARAGRRGTGPNRRPGRDGGGGGGCEYKVGRPPAGRGAGRRRGLLLRRGPLRPRRPPGRAPPPRRAPRGRGLCVPWALGGGRHGPTPRRHPCAARGPVRRGPRCAQPESVALRRHVAPRRAALVRGRVRLAGGGARGRARACGLMW
mmetsp:Transcript_25648/g.72144  ORF Transcript_25648/g.72144 Transcript_25648/m.72144 type:complete len:290 (+) Transcript_25648:245-1114(+)